MSNFSRNEKTFFILAVGLGLFMRFYNLDGVPLSDSEAHWALQALSLARGAAPEVGPFPGYVTLTGLGFYIFTATDVMARFFSALAGSLLVLAPLFFVRWLSPRAAVLLAFGLAIDPGLVAVSRTAGSGMMAISFAVLAAGLWLTEKPRWAGVFIGLTLLSGPALWAGLMSLFITTLIVRGVVGVEAQAAPSFTRENLIQAGLTAMGVFIVVGSLLFTVPSGLGAAFSSPVAFFQGWFASSNVPLARLFIALVAYHIFPLIFGVVGLVRGVRAGDRVSSAMGIWLGVSLALTLASPGHQVTDLAWSLLPLWVLAAREIARYFVTTDLMIWEVGGTFGLTIAIITFAWLDLTSISPQLDQNAINLRLALFFGALALLGMALVLVALGWSPATAVAGGLGGVLTMLVLYTFASAWAAGGMRAAPSLEMWQTDPSIDQSALLVQTVADLAEWNQGVPTSIPVTIMGLYTPSLEWALRDFDVSLAGAYTPALDAPFIITYDDPNLAFAQSYRGQDFFWRQYPSWDSATLTDWVAWLTIRNMPFGQDKIVLWADAAIFPDSK